jgi:coenzyme F420-reducing hydrogenase beta subunit
MVEDEEGFQIPQIDQARCADCGCCAKRCPQNERPSFKPYKRVQVFGAKLKDNEILSKSASGGVFAGIAAEVLDERGNAVFGCAFDANMVARHICVTDIGDLAPCQSSKYVQSDVGDTYLRAREYLEAGKRVFYSGTPCQIAGLYAYLGKDYDGLITADLICHGVPSPLLFKRYIAWLGERFGDKIIYYDFRNKQKHGWGLMIKTKTKTKTIMPDSDPYYNAFLETKTLRECCYSCRYADTDRVGDITLGDFWGVENAHPKFYDPKGVSLVLVNTEKGERLFRSLESKFHIIESKLEYAMQINLKQPSPRHKQRDFIYKNIGDEDIDVFKSASFKPSIKTAIKWRIKSVTPLFALRVYRKMKRVKIR